MSWCISYFDFFDGESENATMRWGDHRLTIDTRSHRAANKYRVETARAQVEFWNGLRAANEVKIDKSDRAEEAGPNRDIKHHGEEMSVSALHRNLAIHVFDLS